LPDSTHGGSDEYSRHWSLCFWFACGWLLLPPPEFSSLGLNIFGGAAFSANFLSLNETGYFDLAAAQKPLVHLWSLGVEEQFYIVWPILLLLAFSRKISVTALAVVLLIASFVWNINEAGSPADFYPPVTPAWELMIGGIIVAIGSQSETLRLDRAMSLLGACPSNRRIFLAKEVRVGFCLCA
jgi:peptidoglycan/LPS O-acetylase OafA/YrhL